MRLHGKILVSAVCGCAAFWTYPAAAAADDRALHATFNSSLVLGLLEIPFLLLAIVYALRTAGALRGGVFGRGMTLMASGLLVMAIGHLLMMTDMAFDINLLATIFGFTLGSILWVAALLASWALLGTGFHSIYRASKA